jgi:hypothetical protein
LYLSGNRLCVLPNTLFQLRQLRVLCLRRNQLSELSSNIRYLTELEELSVGDNHMNDLPIELLELKRLQRVYVHPNPFLKAGKANHIKEYGDTLKLTELATRSILQSKIDRFPIHTFPHSLQPHFSVPSSHATCSMCGGVYIQAYLSDIIFLDFLSEYELPFRIRTCSRNCFQQLRSRYV